MNFNFILGYISTHINPPCFLLSTFSVNKQLLLFKEGLLWRLYGVAGFQHQLVLIGKCIFLFCYWSCMSLNGVGEDNARPLEKRSKWIPILGYISILLLSLSRSLSHSRMNVSPLMYLTYTQNGNRLACSISGSSVFNQCFNPPPQWKHVVWSLQPVIRFQYDEMIE